MKILVSFSGGKDSQASLIKACEDFDVKNITAVFCDTGWEHHVTYKHVTDVTNQLGVKLITLRNNSIDGFKGLCKKMKWFPDTAHRVCTVKLKVEPMIDYILKQDDDLIIIQGIRAAESAQRSKLPCSANYFQEYLDNNKKGLYRKSDVVNWCKKHKATVERPMMGCTAQEVIDYILEHGQMPNPLYTRGATRVGCYPCIFARLAEVKAMRHDVPYVIRVAELEDEVNSLRGGDRPSSFFPKGKIPERFCRKFGNGVPAFEDVINYVSRDDAELLLSLFDNEEDGQSCMSVYHGLCE